MNRCFTCKETAGADHENEKLRAQFSDLEQELETWKTNAQDVHEANDKLRERLSEYDAKYSADMERMEGIAKGLSMKLDAANARMGELSNAIARILKHCEGGNPCAGDASKPCRIHEHNIAREALANDSKV